MTTTTTTTIKTTTTAQVFISADTLTTATTEQLVEASQAGQTSAFGELAARFQEMVLAVCLRRLGDYAEAQEVAQDVLIKAFEKLHQLHEVAAFPGWLRSIAVRQAINRTMQRSRHVAASFQVLDAPDQRVSTPIDSLLASEREEQLHDGLRRLASLDRSTLIAFYLNGQTLVEMSNHFSAPVGTIKRRLHVARKRLAEELNCLQPV
jgi:RNA polymerase sigma-70 factor (ECF subfamily)